MSQEERDWLHWLKLVRDGEMTQRQAAECMKVSDRWVRELLDRYERLGDRAVYHDAASVTGSPITMFVSLSA